MIDTHPPTAPVGGQQLKLRPYQREAVDAVKDAWRAGMNRPAVQAPTGAGKGHPGRTEIPTPDGLRKWGDLRPGDRVYGSNGAPTEVLDVYDRGELPTYRVEFSDGASVEVDADHLWSVRDRKYRRTSREHRTLSTAEIISEGPTYGRSHRFAIPMVAPVERAAANLPIDPYALGALIANGCLGGAGTQLSTPDPEVAARVAAAHALNPINDTTAGVCPRYSLPGLRQAIRDLGLDVHSQEKFIPTVYLEAPVSARIALLQGLMDGDGSSRAGGRRAVLYHTTAPRLADDITELVNSLGGTARARWAHRERPGRPASDECVVSIVLPAGVEPFHSRRKAQAEKPRRLMPPHRSIVAITPAGVQPITCIRVAAADHLYVVARAHIVTHNTVIFSHLISESLADRGGRAVVMVHREELADQAVRKLRQVNPSLRVGKVKARHNEVDADVVVCSVPTLASRGRIEQIRDVRTVICDEAHHALSRTWRDALGHFGSFATTPTAGFSATLARGDGRGLGDIWESVVFQRSTLWAIRHGYLTDVKGVGITVPDMDLSQVERSRGDYTEKGLSYALAFSGAYEVVASEYRELAGDRPGILFAPTVADAEAFAGALTHEGYRVGVITGTTSSGERADIYAAYEAGDLDILASCMVLTEGFDSPRAEVAVIARPTTSAALYAQMVGRVLRLDHRKPDKQALILDVAGVAEHNDLSKSLIDLAHEEVTKVKDGETLAEAAEREEAEAGGQGALKAKIERERIRAVEIDLFGASRHRWMQTPGGTQYLSVPDGWIYLAAGDGGWDVRFRAKTGRRDTVIAAGMDLQYAMAHGEQAGDDAAAQLVTKNARWRKRPPSEKSAAFAERLGLPRAVGANAGQTSDYISAILATRALDPRSTP